MLQTQKNRNSLSWTFTKRFVKTHLTNSIDLAMNDFFCDESQDAVCLNIFDCVFVHKEVRCVNKNQLLPGDLIIYTPEDLAMN